MTALAGYWALDSKPDAETSCQRMLRAQQVYGPQPPQVRSEGAMAIGARFFASSLRGSEAVACGESGALLVADVRLDNAAELSRELGLGSGQIRDQRLLLKALERWDIDAVDRIHGDFAFAYWDPRRRRLLLARDFLGQRPLHYSRGPGFFAFASMAKGLHALEVIAPEPNLSTVENFIALMPEDGPETFFSKVEKVRAGHIVLVTPDGVRSERWWNPAPTQLRLSRSDCAEGLRHHLDRAVADRTGDAGQVVASHLSGGLDSSTVTATAARLLAPSGRQVAAFTAVPRSGYASLPIKEGIADEGPLAAQLAAFYPNIEHVLVRNERSLFSNLEKNFFLFERPMLNLCNAAWFDQILETLRVRNIPVLLTGQAGNMGLSYDGMPLLHQLLRHGRMIRLIHEVLALRRGGMRMGTIGAQAFGPLIPTPLWSAINRLRGKGTRLTDYTALHPAAVGSVLKRAVERRLDTSYRPRSDPLETRLWVLRRVDMGNYNKGWLAGWGVDVRDPTSDRRLIEYCLSIPTDEFLRDGTSRALAREAFADRVPSSILWERRRGYQGADWHQSLVADEGALNQELARIAACEQAGAVLNLGRLQSLGRNLPAHGWHKRATVEAYRLALLRGVSAGHFIRKGFGSNQ